MNWFTNDVITPVTNVERLIEEGGSCEHVEADRSLAAYWSAENDSFGREVYVYCKECWNKAQQEEANQEEHCHDCGKTVLKKDTEEYRWYGFYAPQGDEPLIICKNCLTAERHLNRIKNDQEEFDRDHEDDDYDDYED